MGVIRLLDEPALLWRPLDDEIVVYHEYSGATHRLDPFAAEVFDRLRLGPADAAELSRRIATSLDVTLDEPLERSVGDIIADFQRLGLVEPSAA